MASMEDLAKQRRASVHAAVLKLLEHGANTVAELAVIAAPMNAQDLADAAEERALAGGACVVSLSATRQAVLYKKQLKQHGGRCPGGRYFSHMSKRHSVWIYTHVGSLHNQDSKLSSRKHILTHRATHILHAWDCDGVKVQTPTQTIM